VECDAVDVGARNQLPLLVLAAPQVGDVSVLATSVALLAPSVAVH